MNWNRWPFSKMREVKCPDGSTEFVRDLSDAAPHFIPGYKADVSGDIKGLEQITGSAKVAVENKVQGLLIGLNERNEGLMLNFRVAYSHYETNPCKNRDQFGAHINRLIDEQNRLLALKTRISLYIEFLSHRPFSDDKVLQMFLEIVQDLGTTRAIADATVIEIKNTRQLVEQWQGGADDAS